MDTNNLAYIICNGICYLSIDSGGECGVNVGAKSTVDIATMPDEALPSANLASAACYTKSNMSVMYKEHLRMGRRLILVLILQLFMHIQILFRSYNSYDIVFIIQSI